MKIDADRLDAVQKFAVDDIFISVHIELPVLIVRLIQSHGQARAASSALVQKYTDRTDFLVLKIGRNLFSGRRGNFEHNILLDSISIAATWYAHREAKVQTT